MYPFVLVFFYSSKSFKRWSTQKEMKKNERQETKTKVWSLKKGNNYFYQCPFIV